MKRLVPIPRPHSLRAAAAFAGATAGVAALGALASGAPARSPWLRTLRRPPRRPPSAVFGPIWTALHALVATSGYRVWRTHSVARDRALALWGAQLALHAAWSPLFFGARRPRAALAVLSALAPAAAAYAWTARRADRKAAALAIPFVAWTGFALSLNADLARRSRSLRTLARR
jgi:tryptophan-rich sensory protein